jgi:hypothetical protein
VVNAAGDTLTTLTGPGAPGLHTVTWAYAITPRATGPAALSASEKRDSILRTVRAPQVFDSLTKAKYDSAAIAQVRALINPPGLGNVPFGGRGGGGGGGGRGGAGSCERPLTQWEPFCARPAEAAPPRAGAVQAPVIPQPAAPSAAVLKIYTLIGLPAPAQGGRGGGGFGGFGGGGTADTGDYGIVLQVGTTIVKGTLRVEKQ